MAWNTPKSLRQMVIYEVYVRNHGKTGTFRDVTEDLDRIRSLGADIVWLMPIHPIGMLNKKGALGCPYSIRDYTKVNPEYGTEEDFKRLIDATHQKEMKLMIDVVYNHTSHDAEYTKTHPEFYYQRPGGGFGGKIADWGDIIDLDYEAEDLWDFQIDALKKWALMGVDGYRCDVAPFVPLAFWMRARNEIEAVRPGFIWLAETVHPHFLADARSRGIMCASDSEIYNAFDITYDYDTHSTFMAYWEGAATLEEFLEKKRAQEVIYPDNYVKLRFLENHDIPRAKALLPEKEKLFMWTAFMFFEKGATLLYAGQEAMDAKRPNLFERDPIDWSGLDDELVPWIKTLAQIKKQDIFANGVYRIHKTDRKGIIYATYSHEGKHLAGIFNVEDKIGVLDLSVKDHRGNLLLEVPDGIYDDLLTGTPMEVKNNKIRLGYGARIFAFQSRLRA